MGMELIVMEKEKNLISLQKITMNSSWNLKNNRAKVDSRREDRDGIEGEWGDLSRKSHRSMENGVLSGHIESKEGCCLRDSSHVVHGLDLTHEAML